MQLQFFNTPEGYVEPTVIAGTRTEKSVKTFNTGTAQTRYSDFKYVYQYKDHLGNIRLSYSDNDLNGSIDPATEIIEENNYYPFGLEHKGYNNVVNGTENNWDYQGKENQQELGLNWHDFGARNYDASLGRWMNVDPLAEQYYNFTPYNYAYNTPTFYIDPDGMEIKDPDGIVKKYKKHLNDTSDSAKQLLKSGAIKQEFLDLITEFSDSELNKIEKLEKSDQVYSFSKDNNSSGEGGVTYNSDNQEINISVNEKLGLVAHEINHAYQFEKGEISLMADNSSYGSLYDLTDETSSYNVERAISGSLNYFLREDNKFSNQDVLNLGLTMSPTAYQSLPTISINLKSKQGKNLRKRTKEAGLKGEAVKEVYIGWQKDYNKGVKKRK